MAEVNVGGNAKIVVKPMASPMEATLPETVSKVSDNPNDYHWLIHGPMKIGKTTFATAQEKVLLLTFDPAQKASALLQRHIPDWPFFVKILELLEERAKTKTYPYNRVVIDGADICYRRCQDAVQKKLVVDHISEPKWGLGWDTMDFTFTKVADRFMRLPGGCWWISHSEWKETDSRNGGKIMRLVPLMKARAEECVSGRSDGVMAMDYAGDERIMIIVGDERTGAGHRIKNHFLTPDKRKVKEISMGFSSEEAWSNFMTAFNNEQDYITVAERNKRKAAPTPSKK